MVVYLVSNPCEHKEFYGVCSTKEKAIKLSYDAYSYECDNHVPYMKFSTWNKNGHWTNWVEEMEVDEKSWIEL